MLTEVLLKTLGITVTVIAFPDTPPPDPSCPIVIPGLPHHVTQRGNRREQVFFSDDDYRFYLDELSAAARKAGRGRLRSERCHGAQVHCRMAKVAAFYRESYQQNATKSCKTQEIGMIVDSWGMNHACHSSLARLSVSFLFS
jgi:hypothetical protein